MVRALFVFSILQFAAIMLLYTKLSGIEDGLARPASTAAASNSPSPFRQQPIEQGRNLDEERLRYIIRDELRSELAQLASEQPPVAEAPAPRDPVEAEQQRVQVLQQIEYYSSAGRISDAEMQKLQMEIARLDPAARTEALRALTRAMNSGQLEGRL